MIVAVLMDVTRTDRPKLVRWTNECEVAFKKLKVLCDNPVLKSPDYYRLFTAQTYPRERLGLCFAR